jgi:hypothetical protein
LVEPVSGATGLYFIGLTSPSYRQVFGRRNVSEYRPQKTERLSVAMTSTARWAWILD